MDIGIRGVMKEGMGRWIEEGMVGGINGGIGDGKRER
jgi:hypothetical protein